MKLHLERLPRTIALVCAGDSAASSALSRAARQALVDYRHSASVADNAFVLVLLDQTKLPLEESYICTADWRRVVTAIKALEVRGAPAIGIAGAAAVALRAVELARVSTAAEHTDPAGSDDISVLGEYRCVPGSFKAAIEAAAQEIREARPTAVNLAVGVDRALSKVLAQLEAGASVKFATEAAAELVSRMVAEDEAINRAMGAHGAALLESDSRILTHCNAGSLATAFYGTALGVVYAAAEQGKVERVYADETRPVGQGARLTAWELSQAGVPVTLICDNMAGAAMAQGMVDAVIVGADRIAVNGDVANKIGTYSLSVLAQRHGIPFYVAAPSSTIDVACPCGGAINIEQRAPEEVLAQPIEGVEVWNPAFDVTPAALVTAIITEQGVFKPNEIAQVYAESESNAAAASGLGCSSGRAPEVMREEVSL